MSNLILITGVLFSIILRIFFVINSLDVADVNKLHMASEAMLKGINPYHIYYFAIYPPGAYLIGVFSILISNISNIPFHIVARIWPNLADIIIGLLIYKFMIRLKTKAVVASFWSVFYLLNPISIIISSPHGQLDSITSLLVLLSVYFLVFKSSKIPSYISPLCLGLAIAIKPNPAMLIPAFLLYNDSKLKNKITFLAVTIAPAAISLAPYIIQNFEDIKKNVLGYSGIADLSYAAILRGFWYQKNADIWLPFNQQLLDASKLSFLLGLLFILIIFAKSKNLIKLCLTIYLLFIGIFFGVSAQYLIWILPLAILLKDKMVITFSIAGTLALLGFYTFFGPDILYGKLIYIKSLQSKYMLFYFLGNLVFWITTIWWLLKLVTEQLRMQAKITSKQRKYALICFVLFIISLIPVINLVFQTIYQSFT